MTVRELLMDDAAASEFLRKLGESLVRRCSCGCNQEIRPGEYTERMGDGRVVLADCYYGAFGELLEIHPIGPGRRVRSTCA